VVELGERCGMVLGGMAWSGVGMCGGGKCGGVVWEVGCWDEFELQVRYGVWGGVEEGGESGKVGLKWWPWLS
jgi:hypothetical protein